MTHRLWDISPPVHEGAPVFPGDTPYRQRWAATIAPGCPVNVSEISLSPHVGAHADAPLHYDPAGAPIGEVDLTPFLGPCRVIHAIERGPLIEWAHIAHAVDALPPRVLVRTYRRAPVEHRDGDLAADAPPTNERGGRSASASAMCSHSIRGPRSNAWMTRQRPRKGARSTAPMVAPAGS